MAALITKTGRLPVGSGHITQKSRPIFKDDFLRNVIVSIYFRQKSCIFVFLIRVKHMLTPNETEFLYQEQNL